MKNKSLILAFILVSIQYSIAQNWTPKILGTHSELGNCVAFSNNGELMASGSNDNKVNVWDKNGKLIKSFTAHSVGVKDLKFSVDDKSLFTAGRDNLIRVWNTETWKREAELVGHKQAVNRLAVHPNGKLLYSCSDDLTIKKWDIKSKKVLSEFKGHNERVISIALNNDGSYLVSTSGDKTNKSKNNLIIWNTKNESISYQLEEEQYAIQDARFNEKGTWVLYGGNFNEVVLIDAKTGKVLAKKALTKFGNNSIDIVGTTIYAASTFNGEISVWPIGKEVEILKKHNGNINHIEVLNNKILSIGTDGQVILWTNK